MKRAYLFSNDSEDDLDLVEGENEQPVNVVWRDPETGEMGQSSRVVWSGKTLTVVECEDDTDGADGADATYDTDATGDTEATGDTGK